MNIFWGNIFRVEILEIFLRANGDEIILLVEVEIASGDDGKKATAG